MFLSCCLIFSIFLGVCQRNDESKGQFKEHWQRFNRNKCIQFKAQDVRNVVSNIKRSEEVVITAEESLEEVINSGGDVRYRKQAGNDNVEGLWIQTKEMRDQLKGYAPLLFKCDTTFGTQMEGYKLYIPVFFSNFTGRWEISGPLYLSV